MIVHIIKILLFKTINNLQDIKYWLQLYVDKVKYAIKCFYKSMHAL